MIPAATASAASAAWSHAELDEESSHWLRALTGSEAVRVGAHSRLYALLLRIARAEAHRRSARLNVYGPELDDIAHQSAADALLEITGKLDQFRGESRFTTWAYKFVIFQVAGKINRHHWQRAGVPMEQEDWERLPARLGVQPEDHAECTELAAALRRAVDDVLTDKQRRVFVALVLTGVTLDVLASDLGSNRNAVYKVMFDARRKIRAALVADGYLEDGTSGGRGIE